MQADEFESIRVVDELTAIRLLNLSPRSWDRLRSRGEAPPFTQLSQRRIGYRIADLRAWLDARRQPQTAA
ncbi:MAG: DNA-binding protein [Xanthobacteraceae bacterium]